MTIAPALAHQFEEEDLAVGRTLFSRGSVYLDVGPMESIEAVVAGEERRNVSLGRRGNDLIVSCTCSEYDVFGRCAHIWAAVLAAECDGRLGGFQLCRRIEVLSRNVAKDEAWKAESGTSTGTARAASSTSAASGGRNDRRPAWKRLTESAAIAREADRRVHMRQRSAEQGELLYLIDADATAKHGALVLHIATAPGLKNDPASTLRVLTRGDIAFDALTDPEDQSIFLALMGVHGVTSNHARPASFLYRPVPEPLTYRLPAPSSRHLLPHIVATGRCMLSHGDRGETTKLSLDDGEAWRWRLKVRFNRWRKAFRIKGELYRDRTVRSLAEPVVILESGFILWRDRVSRFELGGGFQWIAALREAGEINVSEGDVRAFMDSLLNCPYVPELSLPEELAFREEVGEPTPRITIARSEERWGDKVRSRLIAKLSFDYRGITIDHLDPRKGMYQHFLRRFLRRKTEAEDRALAVLEEVGFRRVDRPPDDWFVHTLPHTRLGRVVRELVARSWRVEAEGKLYRSPGSFKFEVSSGIDWLELRAHMAFGDETVRIPALLAGLARGENTVLLDDGSYGVLPEQWLKQWGFLEPLGEVDGDCVKFKHSQIGVIDALLAVQPEATCDATVQHLREELCRFEGVKPENPPAGFEGRLRDYQREGLGWLKFLQRFAFGGCLADDMGLGKTIQVLALLESRRELRRTHRGSNRPGPTLVVVPRSLMFNWASEAARFTPDIEVLKHTGPDRAKDEAAFKKYDLVLTTYGTLRRDIELLKDCSFDYVILDEAQAIKNDRTAVAKASRLLRGQYRLALSGTPIENHLGELWSIFEFLNPGLLGRASVLRAADRPQLPSELQELVARTVRPFVLRRTKAAVARDLPEKLEETIWCEFKADQRRIYDELREHYRRAIMAQIDREGLGRSKIKVIEALLRLRQAACHPGLLDRSRRNDPSAKFHALLPQLREIIDEGHKALVFSQFTTLLGILREKLDQEGLAYEYLDGRTRDRSEPVERFQSDSGRGLFLISLKAGGLGLNLTAAEYVFLLDPWWNPAVELQAIDRTHRIGQTRPVFAYRLIARDTVEERVLELQRSKRELADAIITADKSVIRGLDREDLELLLG